MSSFNLVGHRFKLALDGGINRIVHVLSDHRTVGGNGHYIQLVNAAEFFLLRLGGTRHAGDFLIHAEIVLEGDGGERFAFALDLNVLLGFNRLMEAVGIAAAGHKAAGEFIYDDNLSVLDNVVNVALHHYIGSERSQNVVMKLGVLGIGQVLNIESRLRLPNALFG